MKSKLARSLRPTHTLGPPPPQTVEQQVEGMTFLLAYCRPPWLIAGMMRIIQMRAQQRAIKGET